MAITKQQTSVLIYGGVAVAVLLLLYMFSNKISNFFKGEGKKQTTGGGDGKIEVDETKLTYHKEQYNIWADKIYEAFNYTGSDWDAVIEVFEEMETDEDVSQLMNAYGVRTLFIFAIPTAPLNLGQTLQREDNWSWGGVSDVNEVLEEKSITIRF
jgi:hypothetical protein